MADTPSKKEKTHQRMLNAASQNFRSHGYAGVGVDAIAKSAGVTSGAFYAHLGSKDRAFSAALELGLQEVVDAIPVFRRDHGDAWVQAFADYYLGEAHRDDLACGCAMTTLSPEVVRGDATVHGTYEAKMEEIITLIAEGLDGGSIEARLKRSWAMIGTLIGGLTLARAVSSPQVAAEISGAIKSAAVAAAMAE